MALGLSLSLDSGLSSGFAPAAIDTVFAMAADGMKFVPAVAAAEVIATVDSLPETGASILVLAAALSCSVQRIGSDLSFGSALD